MTMAARSLLAVAVAVALLTAGPARAASSSIVPTKNYIDTISGYIDLSTCAEGVLSTVVRAQQSGCGDNEATTSYTCFCTDSSSYFSHMISSEVTNSCGTSGSAQASSAIAVFDGYCSLGVERGLSTTSDAAATTTGTGTGTGTASPAAGATTTAAATQTGASTLVTSTMSAAASATATNSSPDSDSSDNTRTTAIAAGVAVPVGVIGLALVGYLFYRKRVSTRGHDDHLPMASPSVEMSAPPPEKRHPPQELPPHGIQELPPQPREFHELDGNMRHEAAEDAWKRG